jgi:hypothetical protein
MCAASLDAAQVRSLEVELAQAPTEQDLAALEARLAQQDQQAHQAAASNRAAFEV